MNVDTDSCAAQVNVLQQLILKSQMSQPLRGIEMHHKRVCFVLGRRAIHGPEGPQRPMGQEESELASDKEPEGNLTLTSYQNQQGGLSPLSTTGNDIRWNIKADRGFYWGRWSLLKRCERLTDI